MTGDGAVARVLARLSGDLSLVGGQDAYGQSLVDQWVDFASTSVGSTASEVEATAVAINAGLGGGREYLAGSSMTVADCAVWGALKACKIWIAKTADKHPQLSGWWKRMEASEAAEKAVDIIEEARFHVTPAPLKKPPVNEEELMARLSAFVAAGLVAAGCKDLPALLPIEQPPSRNTEATRDIDFCIGLFEFAKQIKAKPDELAARLAGSLKATSPDEDMIVRLSSVGPYLNMTLSVQALASSAAGTVFEARPEPATGKHILVEFSSPNTNKPQHLGHVRNNLLGCATSNLLKWYGHKITRVNLVNDRGIHICKSMLAYRLFGQGETPESSGIKGDHLVGKYYVVFENKFREEYKVWLETPSAKEKEAAWWKSPAGLKVREAQKSERDKAAKIKDEAKKQEALAAIPNDWDTFKAEYKEDYFNGESQLGKQCKQMLVDWEASVPDVRQLWTMMNSWVFDGFYATYKTLGIEFDHEDRESLTYVLGKEIVQAGLERGILQKEPNGAISCDLPSIGLPGMGKKILLRSDGTSVYMTQDLGTAYMRYDKFSPTGLVYVVANEQDDHFKVLFKILGKIRPELDNKCYHLSYGMVNLPSGRMKSREGTVVDADDLVVKIKDLCRAVILEKWPTLADNAEEVEKRARVIGLASLKFYMLAFTPKATVLFDPEKSIEFTGKTGPYMLYSYARAKSVLRNYQAGFNESSFSLTPEVISALASLGTELERDLAQALLTHRSAFRAAAETYEPSRAVEAIYNIAKAFNSLYNNKHHKIAGIDDKNLSLARVTLLIAAARIIKQGLALIGIETLEEM